MSRSPNLGVSKAESGVHLLWREFYLFIFLFKEMWEQKTSSSRGKVTKKNVNNLQCSLPAAKKMNLITKLSKTGTVAATLKPALLWLWIACTSHSRAPDGRSWSWLSLGWHPQACPFGFSSSVRVVWYWESMRSPSQHSSHLTLTFLPTSIPSPLSHFPLPKCSTCFQDEKWLDISIAAKSQWLTVTPFNAYILAGGCCEIKLYQRRNIWRVGI